VLHPPSLALLRCACVSSAWQDIRIGDGPGLTTKAEIGNLDSNLGRVPIADTTAGPIGQAAAINYLVATECGMMGKNAFEAAQILSFCEHIKELSGVYNGLVPWGSEPTKAALDSFFGADGPKDFCGHAEMQSRSSRRLEWFLGRMERLVPGDGHAVGGALSLADVMLFDVLANHLTQDDCLDAAALPAHRRERFASKARTDEALARHPKLAAIVAKVGANPKLSAWLKTRGKQGF